MLPTAHVIASSALGGAESFYLRLLESLNARRWEATAVVRSGSALAARLPQPPHRTLPMSSFWDARTSWSLYRALKQQRWALVQSYMSRACWLTRAPKGVPHIARLGGYYKIKYFRHADHWVGNTRGICDYLIQQGLDARRVHYISNFVVPSETRTQPLPGLQFDPRERESHFILMALGRFSKKKGFDALLSAFAQLPPQLDGRQTHLILLGDGVESQALGTQMRQLGLEQRVSLPGWCHNPGHYMHLADAFVCPSRIEPLGNVILEAWAHGLPVISTRSDGALELIQDGRNGVLVDIDDERAMAHAVQQLASDVELRQHLAAEGADYLKRHHSEAAIVADYQALYQQVVQTG